jgi:hypothetical protein
MGLLYYASGEGGCCSFNMSQTVRASCEEVGAVSHLIQKQCAFVQQFTMSHAVRVLVL